MGLSLLNDANANALTASQLILRDEQLLIQAEVAELDGNMDLAVELGSRMISVQQGYLDLDGIATPENGGQFQLARVP